jgi:hypothetical protein
MLEPVAKAQDGLLLRFLLKQDEFAPQLEIDVEAGEWLHGGHRFG